MSKRRKKLFEYERMDVPDRMCEKIRIPYWAACNILRDLLKSYQGNHGVSKNAILSELEDDL